MKNAPDAVKGVEKLIKKNAPKVKKVVNKTDVAEDTAKAMKKTAIEKVKDVRKTGSLTVNKVGSEIGSREIVGSHYDTILEKHKQNPEFFAHPDNCIR